MIEVIYTGSRGWNPIVTPEGVGMADVVQVISDHGKAWPEVASFVDGRGLGEYINPAHIVAIREVSE